MEVDIPKQPEHGSQSPVLEPQRPPVLKKFPGSKETAMNNILLVVIAVVVVGLGVATGWFLSGTKAQSTTTTSGSQTKTSTSQTTSKDEEGQLDDSMDYQEVDGKLVEGGIKGEGTHHIERDNNPSRYVYLSSTVIDLDKYIDKDVHVWGETISSVNAPWLMDVVKIKINE